MINSSKNFTNEKKFSNKKFDFNEPSLPGDAKAPGISVVVGK